MEFAIIQENPMSTNIQAPSLSSLRESIINAYRMDETECINSLIPSASLDSDQLSTIHALAADLVQETREYKKRQSKIDALLHQYDLSTDEGIALMCLAEALLRIPDKATMDRFISDKLSTVNWKNHLDNQQPLFINAATWSLLITGKIYAPTRDHDKTLSHTLSRTISRMGAVVIRPIILQMMKAIGKQFVMGQTIDAALKRAVSVEAEGYRFSYDMLGEAARTQADADHYYNSYVQAIDAIGAYAKSTTPSQNPGISIKLSALHPRYEYSQEARVKQELLPKLLKLAQQAKYYHIGLTVDAEEADRLDLSLDIFETIFKDPSLSGWEGFGLAVQAYQKRASKVLDWLTALSREHHKRIMVRLVKGAYWDAEIKLSQVYGQRDYPVFTRKNTTDVSYLTCARQLLSAPDCFFPQFGTHNAYSVAAIMTMAGSHTDFEFQCLHGMGQPLYDQIVDAKRYNRPCRIYAPVGTHKDLLGYLVRRLLENGANSSFVNKLADDHTPIDTIIQDPVARIAALSEKPHPRIPQPKAIYHDWENSMGIDLSDKHAREQLKAAMDQALQPSLHAASIVAGNIQLGNNPTPVYSPNRKTFQVGLVSSAQDEQIEAALTSAKDYAPIWGLTSVDHRAQILEKAAEELQLAMPSMISLLCHEAGKSIPDAISEVREAIDFCRYYAHRARIDLAPQLLPGPTGEMNQFSLHPRGIFVCISPWNFPLAIFTGQIVAALVTGNIVIAKPAEQTPLIAFKLIQLLHAAGVPKEALHLLIGPGSVVGAKLVNDARTAGVIFTGSTETAKYIERALANREGGIATLIAETGGQNAMIVDSSALAEQCIMDIVNSAFNSAGQRCSALRVLFVQEEMAPKLLNMLNGYMQELVIGDSSQLTTDIGPVIDNDALNMLNEHAAKMELCATKLSEVPMPSDLNGNFFAPRVYELKDLNVLTREVFGPILHVIRYPANQLDKVMDAIIQTGYGLTLGIHSRIDATIQYISNRMPVGNIYVNRNMIGAVVGVQPFGGERLSGTGPKAGGPHYLPRLCTERTISNNTTAVGGNARLVSLIEDD